MSCHKIDPDIWLLKNTIQEYHWGSERAIAEILGEKRPSSKPQAELWMGAHPKGASTVSFHDDETSLIELLKTYPEELLGEAVAKKFNGELPFLFKILAAEKPLSIQTHPNLKQAQSGYREEERLGISKDAPNRNYKDSNHKPEILCALTPFWLLKGFRKMDEIASYFSDVSFSVLDPEISRFTAQPDPEKFKLLYTKILTLTDATRSELIDTLMTAAQTNIFGEDESRWIITLNDYYPEDAGILSVLLLNLVQMEPGEAIATQAGELHAYLQGVGVELMANSDNVLRGGLTTKHTDIDELIKIVDFFESEVKIIAPEPDAVGLRYYETDSEEFLLSSLKLQKEYPYRSRKSHGIEIWILLEGQVSLHIGKNDSVRHIKKGESFLVPAFLNHYTLEGDGRLFRASIPPSCKHDN